MPEPSSPFTDTGSNLIQQRLEIFLFQARPGFYGVLQAVEIAAAMQYAVALQVGHPFAFAFIEADASMSA